MLEAVLGFYLSYEKVFKFDVWKAFFRLKSDLFEVFREHYKSEKRHLMGEKSVLGLKDLEKMRKEDLLTQLFDEEVLEDVKEKFSAEFSMQNGWCF